jgi:hypothetical protein
MKKTPYSGLLSARKQGLAGNDKASPAVKILINDPNLGAAIAKANSAPITHRTHSQGLNEGSMSKYLVQQLLSRRAQKNTNARSLMRLLPDIELACQILTSSILSPQKMTTTELTFKPAEDIFTPELTSVVMSEVGKYLLKEYTLHNDLSDVLRDVLFEKGSYPLAVVPENSLDRFINSGLKVSTEAMHEHFSVQSVPRPVGILGATKNPRIDIAFESNNIVESNIIFTDNPAILRLGKIKEIERKEKVKKSWGSKVLSNESRVPLYGSGRPSISYVSSLPGKETVTRRSIGKPMLVKFPSEAVLPVHSPGDPSKHVCYLVLLDEQGYPLTMPDIDARAGMFNSDENPMQSQLIAKVASNFSIDATQFNHTKSEHLKMITSVYSQMVEKNLIDRINAGGVYEGAVIADNQDIYQLMLARDLAKKMTQILIVPAEYMTYYAFKHNPDGTGQSLVDEQSTIMTLRAVLLFAQVMSAIKNSMGNTKVSMQLDPNDPDFEKSIEIAQHEFARSRNFSLPENPGDVRDITRTLQNAAVQWDFKGHPRIPDMEISTEDVQSSRVAPDTDLSELMRKSNIMGMGLSPETVDAGANTQFATTEVNNNILLAKRVIVYQTKLEPFIASTYRQIASSDQFLKEKIIQLVTDKKDGILAEELSKPDDKIENKIAASVDLFLNSFSVELPRPTSTTLEKQNEEYRTYSEALDSALDNWISDKILSENVGGNLSEQAANLKEIYKAAFLRKWCADNNYLPELSELSSIFGDSDKVSEIDENILRFTKNVANSSIKLLAKLKEVTTAVDKDLETLGITEPSDVSSDYGSTDSNDSDDLGMDMDLGEGGGSDLTDGLTDDLVDENASTSTDSESDGTEGSESSENPPKN